MLPPFIIEQIRQREERERARREHQPALEIPASYPSLPMREESEPSSADRGVVIIDLMGD